MTPAEPTSQLSAKTLENGAHSSLPSPSSPRIVPRLALSKAEAAEALGCSVGYLDEYVLPELRVVRRGRRVFVAVAELERWLERSAALTLDGAR